MSAELGTGMDYTKDYYAKYRQDDRIFFPVSNTDDALRPKTVIYGFELDSASFAAPETALRDAGELAYTESGRDISIRMLDDGSVVAADNESGESYLATRMYWFAWYTFHPETGLLQ